MHMLTRIAVASGLLGALVVAALALPPAPALAETPELARQQTEYRERREVWEQVEIPSGLVGGKADAADGPEDLRSSGVGRTAMHIHNVQLNIIGSIGYYVKDLAVTLEPVTPGEPVDFDRVETFVIRLQRGHVVVRPRALMALFNRHILDYRQPPLANVKVSTSKGRMTATGDLLQPLPLAVPSEMSGTIRLTRNNLLAYDIDSISAYGLEVGALLRCLNITLPRLISLERPGVALGDFSMLLNPRKVFPPPRLAGRVSKAWVANDGMHLTFADGASAQFDEPSDLGASYIWLQSGDPKFFGLVVTNAKTAVVPAKRGGSLTFNLYKYREQLSKGVGRIDEDGVVTIAIPD